MKTVLVETVQMIKVSYAVECDEESQAADAVSRGEAVPFESKHLSEVITSTRKISREDHDRVVSAYDSGKGKFGIEKINRVDAKSNLVIRPYANDSCDFD